MREMKDSGVEWIGAIPAAWGVHRIASHFQEIKEKNTANAYSNALQFKMGKIIAKPQKWDENETNETYSAYTVVHPNTIMINGLNLEFDFVTQRVARVECNGIITSAYIALSPRDDINAEYICYLLKSYDACRAFHSMGRGLRKILSYSELKNKPIVVPPLAEQERIAAFLDAECAEIDAVLEKTRASIEEYKKLKQAVITQAVTKGIRGDRPMKDSGIEWIGEIPAEWDVVRQKYFWNTVESGVSVNAADKPVDNSEQYGVLKTSSVSKFVFIPTEHKQVNLEEYGRVSCPVRADSIIASRMNTPELVGACGYVQNNYPNLFLPDRLWQITFKDGLSPKYAWYYLSGIRVRQYISSLSTGTSSSMQNISQSQYGNIFITIPSIGEQSEITKYLDEKCRFVDALVTKKQQYLTEIENYKKSLIYEYVTGKKEVV